MPQTIISISREFGSGGREIAKQIAEDYNFNFYDRRILKEISREKSIKVEVLEKYDEKPRNLFLSRRIHEYSNSMEEILTDMQFDYIKRKAESGESFVIVGRCAETILKGFDGLISIFITGDEQSKLERIMKIYSLDINDAFAEMRRNDKKRKQYHNRHSDFKWGDSRNYDLCINSSKLNIEGTITALKHYIDSRIVMQQ